MLKIFPSFQTDELINQAEKMHLLVIMFLLGKREDPEKKPLDPTGLFLNFVASAPGAALYILFPPESPAENISCKRWFRENGQEPLIKNTRTHKPNSHLSAIIQRMAT